MSDYHEVQIYRRTRIPGDVDYSDAGAIRIYGISPAAWPPLLGWWEAASDDVIHLRQVTSAIVALHDNTAELDSWAKYFAFKGKSVIANQRPV
jgi:hypothetical protein